MEYCTCAGIMILLFVWYIYCSHSEGFDPNMSPNSLPSLMYTYTEQITQDSSSVSQLLVSLVQYTNRLTDKKSQAYTQAKQTIATLKQTYNYSDGIVSEIPTASAVNYDETNFAAISPKFSHGAQVSINQYNRMKPRVCDWLRGTNSEYINSIHDKVIANQVQIARNVLDAAVVNIYFTNN
jgi:hypothetical protein